MTSQHPPPLTLHRVGIMALLSLPSVYSGLSVSMATVVVGHPTNGICLEPVYTLSHSFQHLWVARNT